MLQIFKNESFGEIRTVTIDSEPWFVGKDICRALEYKNTRDAMFKHIEKGDKDVAICDTPGGKQKLTIINKSGVYSLILSSKLPTARQFKHWITSEVIPEIEETGSYNGNKPREMTDEEILSRAVLVADRTIKALENKNQALEAKIETDRPKVEFAEAILTSETCISIGNLAKLMAQNGIKIGRNRLFNWMRENRYLIRDHKTGENIPDQRSIEMGILKIRTDVYCTQDGKRTKHTPQVTPKGQEYFIRKLKEQNGKDDRNGILFN